MKKAMRKAARKAAAKEAKAASKSPAKRPHKMMRRSSTMKTSSTGMPAVGGPSAGAHKSMHKVGKPLMAPPLKATKMMPVAEEAVAAPPRMLRTRTMVSPTPAVRILKVAEAEPAVKVVAVEDM